MGGHPPAPWGACSLLKPLPRGCGAESCVLGSCPAQRRPHPLTQTRPWLSKGPPPPSPSLSCIPLGVRGGCVEPSQLPHPKNQGVISSHPHLSAPSSCSAGRGAQEPLVPPPRFPIFLLSHPSAASWGPCYGEIFTPWVKLRVRPGCRAAAAGLEKNPGNLPREFPDFHLFI